MGRLKLDSGSAVVKGLLRVQSAEAGVSHGRLGHRQSHTGAMDAGFSGTEVKSETLFWRMMLSSLNVVVVLKGIN